MFLLPNSKKSSKDRVSQLSHIINTISISTDIKGLLETTLKRTLDALASERGSIFLAGDDGKELFLKLSCSGNMAINDVKKKVGEGIIGEVAKNRKPLLVKDVRHDARFSIAAMYKNYKTNSFLCVPIATDVKLIGVINITESKSKKPYNVRDLRFLKIVADHIALKID